jgi:hypothetical protein
MTAQPRKPRPIGPRAVEEMADDEREGPDVSQDAFQAFQDSLTTDELLDWDDAAGGVIGMAELRPTMRLLLSMAWIVKRRSEPRLTWREVRKRPVEDNMAMVAEVMEQFTATPKDGTAPAS